MESLLKRFLGAIGIKRGHSKQDTSPPTYDSTTTSTAASDSSPKQSVSAAPTVNVDGVERHGYLFGQKITHSYSPLLHRTIYKDIGLNWEQFRLDSADIPHFLELIKDPRFYGMNQIRRLSVAWNSN